MTSTGSTGAASYNFTADPRYGFLLEPKPWLNQPETIVGFTATLTASIPPRFCLDSTIRERRANTPATKQTISGFCVLSRLYTRWVVIKALGWDDLFVGLYLVRGA